MRNTIILLALFCAACSGYSFKPYRMDIQQGNVVTPKMMMQLRPGMSKAQVRYVMGTPLVVDAFRVNRWDYLYRMEKGGKLIEERHVVLEFDNDKLVRVSGDVIPAGSSGETPLPAAPAKSAPAVTPLPLPSFEQPAAPATAPAAKPEPAPESQAAPAPKAEPAAPVEAPKAAPKPEPQAAPVPKPMPQAAPVVAPVPKAEPKPEPVKAAPAPVPKPAPRPEEEDLPPEESPSYFERMLEKIGF